MSRFLSSVPRSAGFVPAVVFAISAYWLLELNGSAWLLGVGLVAIPIRSVRWVGVASATLALASGGLGWEELVAAACVAAVAAVPIELAQPSLRPVIGAWAVYLCVPDVEHVFATAVALSLAAVVGRRGLPLAASAPVLVGGAIGVAGRPATMLVVAAIVAFALLPEGKATTALYALLSVGLARTIGLDGSVLWGMLAVVGGVAAAVGSFASDESAERDLMHRTNVR